MRDVECWVLVNDHARYVGEMWPRLWLELLLLLVLLLLLFLQAVQRWSRMVTRLASMPSRMAVPAATSTCTSKLLQLELRMGMTCGRDLWPSRTKFESRTCAANGGMFSVLKFHS